MDEFELKILLGNDRFDEGMGIVKAGGVKPCVEIAEGIFTFGVTDGSGSENILLKRVYPSGEKADLYDCDCGIPRCKHYSAVMISEYLTDEIQETDQSTIDRIIERIDSLVNDIVSDSEYDEEENYWEDWEIRKYDLEQHNSEVEEEHVADILADIFDSVTDPGTVLDLLDRLFSSLRSMEYDNGGTDDAIDDYEDEIRAAVSYVDEIMVSKYLSSRNSWGEPWIKKYLGDRFDELEGAAYKINLKKGDSSPYMRERMLENGDYDELIACRDGNIADIVAVVKHLLRKGYKVRAGEYALKLLDKEDLSLKAVDAMYSAGLVKQAAPLYLRFFKGVERLEYLEKAFDSDEVDRTPYLDKVLGYCKGISEYDPKVISFLVRHGRGDDAVRVLESVRYRPKADWGNIDLRGARSLFYHLNNKGYTNEAAKVLRYVIDSVLSVNDNKNYETIVDMIRDMEADERFEEIPTPHSRYMDGLRDWASKKRKFWAIYNGTYVKKERSYGY